ncbi:uncharacterized protein Z519_06143 [Cladophialophora bantiana CBS 173.52]|uniref:Calcineurin-like phosphoesterase domain-containing protein n=1 Tax=Cladophialophora bantiana (strain ATCC 10958 / CBS 173.52 / CDC B-1940 / NIH 8579) TaxID=1442370 RepID=A0A0D2HJV2_CLAB1|nr:uncharacterized protein Z519_06143 [Cladophialophora bantiana CBS 173.52]KIW93538.1 hypothetical protein Z519_06143 [Cladophialophora bantiana CBS 173.52]
MSPSKGRNIHDDFQNRKRGKMISTRILIISDTHAQLPLPAEEGSPVPFRYPLPSADVLIHCGDFTLNGKLSQHEAAVELLRSTTADLKIVYRRFPDKYADYGPYSEQTLDRIRELYTSPQAKEAGIRYLEEGVAGFELRNGARLTVYASAYQPAFCDWAFGYPRSIDRFNLRPGGGGGPEHPVPDHGDIDIMITHGPPKGILDKVWRGENVDGPNVGCEHLRRAVERCRPRIHCFGHIREACGAVMKRWNAVEVAGPEQVCAEEDPPSLTFAGDGTGGWEDNQKDGSAAKSVAGLGPLHSTTTERRRQPKKVQEEGEPEILPSLSNLTASSKSRPVPPYHPCTNPSSYYMYAHQLQQHDNAGETLLLPDPYDDQVRRKCIAVDVQGLNFGRETLFVNASIVNLRYKPLNAPWVVDVMLPEAAGGEHRTGLGAKKATLSSGE